MKEEGDQQRDGSRQGQLVATGAMNRGRVGRFSNALVLLPNVMVTVMEMREVVA